MALAIFTVLVSVLVGYARGGRLRNLARVDLRAVWLVAVAVVAQVLLSVVGPGAAERLGPILLATSHVALLLYIWANRLLPGMTLIFAGFALNAVVITANGAMPVSVDAIRVLEGTPTQVELGKHRVLREDDPLPFLADVLPIPALRTIVSVGDVLLAAGVVILVANLMQAHRHPRPATRAAENPPSEEQ